jgi:hypothetical protein
VEGKVGRRRFRELAWILRARARAAAEGRPYGVFLGYVRKAGNRGRLHLRSTYVRSPKGAALVAWCSATGFVRLYPPWSQSYRWFSIPEEKLEVNHELSRNAPAGA